MVRAGGAKSRKYLVQVSEAQKNLAIPIVLQREQVHVWRQPLRVTQEALLRGATQGCQARALGGAAEEQNERIIYALLQGAPVCGC